MSARRLLGLVGGLALLAGCLAEEALCTPADSTYACCVKQHAARPQSCGAEPGLSGTAMATGTLIAAATLASDEALLPVTTRDAVEKALKECALEAHEAVNRKHFGGEPTRSQCREVLGKDPHGNNITRATQIGQEKHRAARACVEERLGETFPGRFSLEQRYRYDREAQRIELVSDQERIASLRQNQGLDLKGTLAPDVVIHTGDPLKPQAVYDFKFPCLRMTAPVWTVYPPGHPHEDRTQGMVYQEAFGSASRVTPWELIR